mmetsp:Transcript_8428/g.16098  ORF Transcript_8428/g.16098 Transcript_8428/m.16098 type:complete len:658 (+) Transcript_8428:103-2076(+)
MAMTDNEGGKEEILAVEPKVDGNSTDTRVTSSSNPKETTPADQLSQSLPEDDSFSHSIKSGKSSGVFLSSSESAFATASTAVTAERKEVLLAQARADRLEWIRKVPLPYKCEEKSARKSSSDSVYSELWERDPRLAELKNTFVMQQSESALQVLSHLYGMDQDIESVENATESLGMVSKRVGAILDRMNQEDGDDDEDGRLAMPTAEQIRSTAMAQEDGDSVLRAYHSWVSKLSDPASAVLVQGMRGFCRKIRNEPAESLHLTLQGYLRLTCESLREYAPWKETEIGEETRRSFESFVYGHLVEHIDHLYWTEEAKEEERKWQERLGSLQFVSPKHLEIACLADGNEDYREIFQKPVEVLSSAEAYFSPFEKLQRVLTVYHNVNEALTVALNRANNSGTKKLPSADDVLPSIILTVILARPARLLLNLQLIEDFSPPEYLRGEAGYAYTNLYGAVQFLKDIDLDADKPASLHIDGEEFRNSLKACREAAEAKHAQRRASTVPLDAADQPPAYFSQEDTLIPVTEIRGARMRGEVVDIEWAKQRFSEFSEHQLSARKNGSGQEGKPKEDSEELPAGFSRSYTFLSSRPEDIKVSDLPKLLAEYKMLVHTTETLIGEKFSRAAAEKKAKLKAKQKQVYDAAKKVDPSLLPPATPSSKRS